MKLAALLIAPLLLAACSSEPSVEFRAASLTDAQGTSKLTVPGSAMPVFVGPQVVITSRDIASAQHAQAAGGGRAVEVTLTDAGAEKLGTYTSAHLGEPIAILVHGQLCSAPIVRAPLTRRAMILGGSGGLSEAQADELVKSLNR